jgi:transposase InsO family protein
MDYRHNHSRSLPTFQIGEAEQAAVWFGYTTRELTPRRKTHEWLRWYPNDVRESLAIEVGQRLRGEDVVGALNQIRQKRGTPKLLFCDNGSEFGRSRPQ